MSWQERLVSWLHAPMFWMVALTASVGCGMASVLAPVGARRRRERVSDVAVRDVLASREARDVSRIHAQLEAVRVRASEHATGDDIERARKATVYAGAPL